MQDEVADRVVALCINGGKISERILRDSIRETLAEMERRDRRKEDAKQRKKDASQRKKAEMRQKKKRTEYRGKQSLKKLQQQGRDLSSIKITDGNIRSFEKYARKYSVDYCLKKDSNASPPRYYVFFKAKDVDAMTAAFQEYTGHQLKKEERPSIREKLEKAKKRKRGKEEHKPHEQSQEQSRPKEPSQAHESSQEYDEQMWAQLQACAREWSQEQSL